MPSYVRGRRTRRLPDCEIVRLYVEDHLDADTIGLRANCTSDVVRALVRDAGGTIRGRGGHDPDRLAAIDRDEICRLYLDGMTGPAVASAAGVARCTVYAILRAAGITRPWTGDTARASLAATAARKARKAGRGG